MFTILGADGKEYGPVTAGKIHEWIAGGRANLQTKVRREGETEWRTIGDISELSQFGASGGSPPPALPPIPAAPANPAGTGALTPAAAASELELAGRGIRLGAVLLDSIIGGCFLLPALAVLGAAGVFNHGGNQPNTALLIAGFGLMGLSVIILLGIQIYLLSTRGQTIGKKLLAIKIVNFDDEGNPGFVKAFLIRALVNGLLGAIPFIGAIYNLVDICFIFRDDRRCIHDLLANTKVVKA